MFAQLERHREHEIMDEPGLNAERHRAALVGLSRINIVSDSAGVVWPALRQLARTTERPIRVLDLGTGGGDVPIRLWRRARRAGIEIRIDGCDVSPTAIDYAARQAKEAGADVGFFPVNVRESMPDGYDVIMCSLFLHHFDEPDAIDLLRRMGQAARRLVMVNDLARGRIGLVLAHIAARFLSRSEIVRDDGPRSVVAAFTPSEALSLAERAGLHGAHVRRIWPLRYLLTWEKPRAS